MPLSSSPETNETADNIVKSFHEVFGPHPGYRAVHAKGALLTGTFTPSSEAPALSKAYHFTNSVPVTARFSSSGGLPHIPDTDPNGDPRGFAIRFHYPNDSNGKRIHTDVVSHSTPHFPVSTGQGFLDFLTALKTGKAGEFIGSHPTVAAFVSAPKPTPQSFATELYYGLSAYKLIDNDGKVTFARYRFLPEAGHHTLDSEALKSKGDDFLYEELPERIAKGPIKLKLVAQLANEGDPTDNITQQWPEDRKIIELGDILLDEYVEQGKQFPEQKKIIFDPVPRNIEGLEAGDDPLFDMRAAIYLISGKERREADVLKPE